MGHTGKPIVWARGVPAAFYPSRRLILAMVRRIVKEFGVAMTAQMIGVREIQIELWLSGRFKPARTSERVVWLIYCMLYDPKKIRTVTDLLTWGRLRE